MLEALLERPEEDIPSAMTLTQDDVQRLLTEDGPAVRVDITDKIAGAYGKSHLEKSELAAAEQIFRLLMRDTELSVRVSLSLNLKDSKVIPHDIVMVMARDVEEVSLPVLECSQVLSDDDLLHLIRATDQVSRHIAISRRAHVSNTVSVTLMDKGNEQVLSSLISNNGADISETDVSNIIEQHKGNEALMKTLGERPRLPSACVEKLINVVSENLGETLKKKYKLTEEQIRPEVEKTRETETLYVIRDAGSQDDIDTLIDQLHAYNRLTPSIILSALCQGHFAFFETSLAELSNVPVANVRTLISDRGELGFRAIYNKSGLPETMFPAVKMLLKVVRELVEEGEKPGTSRFANRVVEHILQYAEENPVENLSYIIALVRKVGQ